MSQEAKNETECKCPCGKAGHWVESKPLTYQAKPLPKWLKTLLTPLVMVFVRRYTRTFDKEGVK